MFFLLPMFFLLHVFPVSKHVFPVSIHIFLLVYILFLSHHFPAIFPLPVTWLRGGAGLYRCWVTNEDRAVSV